MENFSQAQFYPQINYYNFTELSTINSPSVENFIYPTIFFSQMINRMTILQKSLENLMNQLSQIKVKSGNSSFTEVSAQLQLDEDKSKAKICRVSKVFPKHLKCPIKACRKCYSSRIAMRSHLRKFHQVQLSKDML